MLASLPRAGPEAGIQSQNVSNCTAKPRVLALTLPHPTEPIHAATQSGTMGIPMHSTSQPPSESFYGEGDGMPGSSELRAVYVREFRSVRGSRLLSIQTTSDAMGHQLTDHLLPLVVPSAGSSSSWLPLAVVICASTGPQASEGGAPSRDRNTEDRRRHDQNLAAEEMGAIPRKQPVAAASAGSRRIGLPAVMLVACCQLANLAVAGLQG